MGKKINLKIKRYIYIYPLFMLAVFIAFLIASFPIQYLSENMSGVSIRTRLFFLIAFLMVSYIILFKKNFKIQIILEKRNLCIFLLLLIFVLQIIVIIFFKVQPINDLLALHDEAIRMLSNPKISLTVFREYFARYPNNYGLLVMIYMYYRVLEFFNISSTYFVLAANILNAVLIDVGILFTALIGKKLKGIKVMNILMVMFLLLPWTYFWVFYYYSHTVSFFVVMLMCYLVMSIYFEKALKKKVLKMFLLGMVLYFGYKIRITNLFVAIAVVFVVFAFGQAKKMKQYLLFVFCIIIGVTFSSFLYGQKTKNMLPRSTDKAYPTTHWIMMASHGTGGYNLEDVNYTTSFETKEEKVEANVKKIKKNINDLGFVGCCKLIGTKARIVWLVGDDNIVGMSKCCKTYTSVHKFLNGQKSGWLIMYAYLLRLFMLCMILIEVFYLMKNQEKWGYFFSIVLLGAISFHCIWEANPKYSICFMGIMMLLMSLGLVEKKENCFGGFICNKKIILIGSFIVVIFLLNPFYNYYTPNSFREKKNYATYQMASNKNFILTLNEGESFGQKIKTDHEASEVQVNVTFMENISNCEVELWNQKGLLLYQTKAKNIFDSKNNQIKWKLPAVISKGKYTILFVTKGKTKVSFPVYSTGNYDVYEKGEFLLNNKYKKWVDMLFVLSV